MSFSDGTEEIIRFPRGSATTPVNTCYKNNINPQKKFTITNKLKAQYCCVIHTVQHLQTSRQTFSRHLITQKK